MLIPFGLGDLYLFNDSLPVTHFIGTLIFIIASTTDWIDGHLARKHNLVTNLGKFLDPLADKLLVSAALIVLVELQLAPSWMVIVIISREFAVTGLRLVAAGEGQVMAAGKMGKLKTVFQIIAISALLLHNIPFKGFGIPLGDIALWIAVALTILSGLDYFARNTHVFKNSK